MDNKESIRALMAPKAVLQPLSEAAALAVPDGMLVSTCVPIREFPFEVGWESRGRIIEGAFVRTERLRFGEQKPTNDLYLIDAATPLNVSREHFRIERTDAGYLLVDRGSACGTSVNGVRIGGAGASGSAPLKDGDTIGVGRAETPYLYAFIVLTG